MIFNAEFRSRWVHRTTSIALLIFLATPCVYGQRTQMKPGFNLFSVQQDVELGQQVAQDAENQLPMLKNSRVDDYLNRLGKRLASYAPGEKYPYQFKCVNDSSINAFALPGGFLYINRGVIEAAENEAELASVMGHEIGHVALRHGTNQASKAQLAQAPLAILGSVLGGDSTAGMLAELGAGFALNSVLLKYSRDAERQSDLIGAQILFDANYDPRYVARFFEKLEAGERGTDFFSSHPHPENRIENIHVEIGKLGSRSGRTVNNSSEFQQIKNLLKSLPPAPEAGAGQESASSRERTTQGEEVSSRRANRPPDPSRRFRGFFSEYLRLRYPENWKVFGHDREFTMTPEGGIVRSNNGSAVAYGASIAVFSLPGGQSGISLEEATARSIEGFQRSNPSMRLIQDRGRIRLDGKQALARFYENESPLGGREIDMIITVMRPEGLTAFIFVAPEEDFSYYQRTFEEILDSVDFNNR